MRLDFNKSYGVVGGHPSAMYVQNGVLFNGAGEAIEEQINEVKDSDVKESSHIQEFLEKILSGGPIVQTTVKKESENQGFIWSEVLSTAAEIGVVKFKSTNQLHNLWKLKEQP